MQKLAVGERCPYPLRVEGMQVVATPNADSTGISMTLVCAMNSPTPKEIRALTKEKLRVALFESSPLVWVIVAADMISLDAPYGVGINGSEYASNFVQAIKDRTNWTENTRQVITIIVVDLFTNIIKGLRVFSLSRTWWDVLAGAIEKCPTQISSIEYNRAIERDLKFDTKTMLTRASIVERVGI